MIIIMIIICVTKYKQIQNYKKGLYYKITGNLVFYVYFNKGKFGE